MDVSIYQAETLWFGCRLTSRCTSVASDASICVCGTVVKATCSDGKHCVRTLDTSPNNIHGCLRFNLVPTRCALVPLNGIRPRLIVETKFKAESKP